MGTVLEETWSLEKLMQMTKEEMTELWEVLPAPIHDWVGPDGA